MKFLLGLTFLPLICLGVSIIIGIVILVALRRGTQTVSQYAEEQQNSVNGNVSANTRWARGDLKGVDQPVIDVSAVTACPACGGSNPEGSAACKFCGREL